MRIPKQAGPNTGLMYWNTENEQLELLLSCTKVFSVNVSNAGYTDIWTPAAGRKFRLMGWSFFLQSTAAWSSIAQYFHIRDNTTVLDTIWYNPVASTGPPGVLQETVMYPPPGILSATVNNKLRLYVNGAITTGQLWFRCWGCEEDS